MSAPDFRDWLNDGEKALQRDVDSGADPPADGELDDEEETLGEDEALNSQRAENESASSKIVEEIIETYRIGCELGSDMELPEYHDWEPAAETVLLPMDAGVVNASRRIAALFGCTCRWEPFRSGYGELEFEGYDDNPDYGLKAMRLLVGEALSKAIRTRSSSTQTLLPLRIADFVSGYCDAVAEQLDVFLEERRDAWDAAGGRMTVLLYARSGHVLPEVPDAPADDEDYIDGAESASDRI